MSTTDTHTGSRINKAKFILEVATSALGMANVIPGVKGAADLAIKIVDVVQVRHVVLFLPFFMLMASNLQTVQNNKKECLAVANRSVEVVMVLVNATSGLTVEDISPSLQDQLKVFSE